MTFRIARPAKLVPFKATLERNFDIASRPHGGPLPLNECGDPSFRDIAGTRLRTPPAFEEKGDKEVGKC